MSVQHAALSVYLPAAFDQFLINSVPKFHLDCSSSAHSNGLETVATSRKLLFGILDHPRLLSDVILTTGQALFFAQDRFVIPCSERPRRRLCVGYNYDSTAIRPPFDYRSTADLVT